MNKAQLVETVQKALGTGTTKSEAERAVSAVFESVKAGLKKEKNVQLIGFGTFKVVDRKARTGINPKTREKIKIKKSKTVRFTPGKALKSKI